MGKKRAKQFFQKHSNNASKMLGKKSLEKPRKTFFYIHTNIVTKKWGEQNARKIFQKHSNSAIKKFGEIKRRKKCLNRF